MPKLPNRMIKLSQSANGQHSKHNTFHETLPKGSVMYFHTLIKYTFRWSVMICCNKTICVPVKIKHSQNCVL